MTVHYAEEWGDRKSGHYAEDWQDPDYYDEEEGE